MPEHPLSQAAMRQRVESYFDAVGRGDRDALLEIFTPGLRWRVPQGAIAPYAGLHEGGETVADLMLGAVGNSFVPGSQQTEIKTVLFGENLLAAETVMTAETPDGRNYRNNYTFFFEFEGGRISEIREHVDTRYAADFFAS
ncbi:MAG: nuclear transport factor 2 family protein [Myxococcota bacterium]